MASRCIDDDYEHQDSSLVYVMENVLSMAAFVRDDQDSKTLRNNYNSLLLNFCECANVCDVLNNCSHESIYIRYVEGDKQELVVKDGLQNDLIYECSGRCICVSNCPNRLVQYGPRKDLKVVYSPLFKSQGLITTVAIPRGAFICEYAGELLTPREAHRRIKKNEKDSKMNYILFLNEIQEGEPHTKKCIQTIVDPSHIGNIGRYMNHSCDPNCEIYSVRVDCPIPKICIFSKRAIEAGEELCFHYGGGYPIKPPSTDIKILTRCLCSTQNCEMFLPNSRTEFKNKRKT